MTFEKLNFITKNGKFLDHCYLIIGTKEETKPTKYRDGIYLDENSRFFEKDTFDLYFMDANHEWKLGGGEE